MNDAPNTNRNDIDVSTLSNASITYKINDNVTLILLNSGFRYSKIYATGDEYIYANTFDVDNPIYSDTFMIQNNALVNGDESKLVRVEAESLVANQIRNYVGGNLHNIVIYQESHH